MDGGVRLVAAVVKGRYGRPDESHAFIYDSGFTDLRAPGGQGAWIDSTRKAHRVLESSDRATVGGARKALNGMFSGRRVDIRGVWRVLPTTVAS